MAEPETPPHVASTAARAVRMLTGDAWTFDPVGAGVRIFAVTGALAVGALLGWPYAGVLAAGGAFSVGFGAPLDLRGSRPLLLLAATGAIGAAAVVGSVAGSHAVAAAVWAAALGGLAGVAASRGPGPAWIAIQCALAGILATSYPASPAAAAARALAIAGGGLAQTTVLLLAGFARRRFPPSPPAEPDTGRYPLHLALGLAAAMALERALGLRNGYWVPLTTLLVLRPAPQSTFARALSRTLGTLGGAAVSSGLLLSVRPPAVGVGVLVGAAAFGAYLFQKATYGLLSACVTAYVVFLLSLVGMPEGQVAVARIVATVIGAIVGLAVHAADSAWGGARARVAPPGRGTIASGDP